MDMDENQMNLESSQSEGILDSTDQSGMMLFSSKVDDSDSADEESETYYFESDHIALKGNHDYQMMLRTIAVLEAQRIQVKLNIVDLNNNNIEMNLKAAP